MKAAVAVLVLGACALASCYDEKFDNVDVDKILANEKMFKDYIACLLDQGLCDLDNAKELKSIVPELVQTACAKCNPKQVKDLRKFVLTLQERMPYKFKELETKYDPRGEHKENFAQFIAQGM